MKHNPHSKAKVQCWTIASPAGLEPEPSPAPTGHRDPMHGYSLAAIDHLTRLVLRIDRWYTAGDIDERFDAVRHAIVEHLLTANETPTRNELIDTGVSASDRAVYDEAHTHGRDAWRVRPMPEYFRYWESAHRGVSPETHTVERRAVAQIWPRLLPHEQAALGALADTDDYALAAQKLGIPQGTLTGRLSAARRRFLRLWHEGETPSRLWRLDKRVGRRDGLDMRGRPRLTAAQVDAYRCRRLAGETLTSLAAEAGVSLSCLSRLVNGKRLAPDAAR